MKGFVVVSILLAVCAADCSFEWGEWAFREVAIFQTFCRVIFFCFPRFRLLSCRSRSLGAVNVFVTRRRPLVCVSLKPFEVTTEKRDPGFGA